MAEHDGWTIKWMGNIPPKLSADFFSWEQSEVIKKFEVIWGKRSFEKKARKGHCGLVKVKLVEVR